MKRNQLIGLLQEYASSYPEELIIKKRMLDFIMQYPDCFERSLEVGHITGSAWLLNSDGSKALLMHHAKLNIWVQLGGHCDGDSDVLAVAIKEAQEESGIANIIPVSDKIFDIDIHLVPERKHEKEHYHYDVRFLLKVVGNQDYSKNSESSELRWVLKDYDALPTHDVSILRMFKKWVTRDV